MEIHAHILCLMAAATDSRNAKLQMISRQREWYRGVGERGAHRYACLAAAATTTSRGEMATIAGRN